MRDDLLSVIVTRPVPALPGFRSGVLPDGPGRYLGECLRPRQPDKRPAGVLITPRGLVQSGYERRFKCVAESTREQLWIYNCSNLDVVRIYERGFRDAELGGFHGVYLSPLGLPGRAQIHVLIPLEWPRDDWHELRGAGLDGVLVPCVQLKGWVKWHAVYEHRPQ